MRLLYFSRDYTTHDYRFLSKLAGSNHEVFYLRLENGKILYEQRALPKVIHSVDWPGGKENESSPDSWLKLLANFESVLSDIQPDLIHAGPVQTCGYLTATVDFHPFMLASWGSDILVDAERDEKLSQITNYTLKRSDMLLCDCKAVRNKVQQLITYTDDRIVQFPWGVDLNQFRQMPGSTEFRKKLGWEDDFIILSTRSWEQIYGIDVVLQCFRQAYFRNSNLRLLLLGEGSQAGKIKKYINQHDLSKVISCPGIVPEKLLPEYFSAADLYLTCSQSDGTSISLLQALATGLPVVATDIPGNREWIQPDRNGWLAPSNDWESFANIIHLSSKLSPIERNQIAEINRQIATERANWDVNFNKLLVAYDRLLPN